MNNSVLISLQVNSMGDHFRRPPSACPPSPVNLSPEPIDADEILRNHVPVNALVVTHDEPIFLATAGALQDLKQVLVSRKLGYVFLGKINQRVLFVLNVSGKSQAAPEALAILQPRVVIWLGYCQSTKKSRAGDVLVADTVLCRADHKIEALRCSEFLTNVFSDGRYGWSAPCPPKQAVHTGSVIQPARKTADGHDAELSRLQQSEAVAFTAPRSSGKGIVTIYHLFLMRLTALALGL